MSRFLIAALLSLSVSFGGNSSAQEKAEPSKQAPVGKKDRGNGWLGVATADMTSRLAKKMNTTITEGAVVKDVVDDSPAEKAGLKEDDVIVGFGGTKIADADDLLNAVRHAVPGTTASISVIRNGEKKTLQAEVGKMPPMDLGHPIDMVPPIPPVPRIRVFGGMNTYGLSLLTLNRQLGHYFEAPNGRGVLVEEVDKNSAAEKAGFKAGDVIVSVTKETVEDMSDVQHALRDFRKGEKADFSVLRKGTQQTITMEIEEPAFGRHFRIRSHGMPHSFDFELFDDDHSPVDLESLHLERNALKRTFEEFRHEMKGIGEKIQEEMKVLRERLRNELRQVTS